LEARCSTFSLPREKSCDAMLTRRKQRPCQTKDLLAPQLLLVRYEEDNTTVGTHAQEEGGRHDVQEEEVAADAVPVLHNGVMEVEGNSPVKVDAHDGDNDHRGNRSLFHSAFGRSPLLHPVLMPTRRVATFVSSFVLRLRRECCLQITINTFLALFHKI